MDTLLTATTTSVLNDVQLAELLQLVVPFLLVVLLVRQQWYASNQKQLLGNADLPAEVFTIPLLIIFVMIVVQRLAGAN